MDCLGGAYGVSMGIRGCPGFILCQKRLRLSWEVDECKPLPMMLSAYGVAHVSIPGTRGLHWFTSQLNLSCSDRQIHPLIPHDTSQTPPKLPLHAPLSHTKALTLSLKVKECEPLPGTTSASPEKNAAKVSECTSCSAMPRLRARQS